MPYLTDKIIAVWCLSPISESRWNWIFSSSFSFLFLFISWKLYLMDWGISNFLHWKDKKSWTRIFFFVKSFFGKIQEILILLITSGVFFSYFYRKEPRHRKPLEEFIPILKRVSSWPNVWITTISKKTGRRLRQKLPENIVKMGEITLLKMVTSYFSNLTQVPDWLLEKRNRPPRFFFIFEMIFFLVKLMYHH